MGLDHRTCCPRCGQAVAPGRFLYPDMHLTVAERLVWRELASVEGAIVPYAILAPFSESDLGLKVTICRLRRKTGRTIRNVWGRGYLLEHMPVAVDAG